MLPQKQSKNNKDLMRYAGLGTQLFVLLALALFAGSKADKWLHLSMPLLVWLLPLVALSFSLYKLIRETSKPKKHDEKE